jgi:hypothetical protein
MVVESKKSKMIFYNSLFLPLPMKAFKSRLQKTKKPGTQKGNPAVLKLKTRGFPSPPFDGFGIFLDWPKLTKAFQQ